MKKILFSMFAIAAIVSCNKNEATPMQPVEEPGVIRFGVSELVATRAVSESTGATVEANGFNVAGVTSDNVEYFNALATWNGSAYETAIKYYYPSGKTMSFYAVHPVSESINVAEGVATVSYTHSQYEDLIVAKREAVTANAAAVELTFDHALSQLLFTATGSDTNAEYVLESIVVKAPNGGTYKYADGKWNRGELADQQFWATNLPVSTSAKTAIDESMTFVPGEIQVTASWKCYVDDQLVGSYTKSTPAVGESGAIVLDQAKANTINLTLPNADAVGIMFSVTVNPWGEAEQDVTLD